MNAETLVTSLEVGTTFTAYRGSLTMRRSTYLVREVSSVGVVASLGGVGGERQSMSWEYLSGVGVEVVS